MRVDYKGRMFSYISVSISLIILIVLLLPYFAPLFIVRGVARGYISLLSYNIVFFEDHVKLSIYDSLFPVRVLHVCSVIVSASYLLLFALRVKNTRKYRSLFYGILSLSISLGITKGILLLIELEAKSLAKDLSRATSAGFLKIGEIRVEKTFLFHVINDYWLIFLALTIFALIPAFCLAVKHSFK